MTKPPEAEEALFQQAAVSSSFYRKGLPRLLHHGLMLFSKILLVRNIIITLFTNPLLVNHIILAGCYDPIFT
jgi:hypothetical protein